MKANIASGTSPESPALARFSLPCSQDSLVRAWALSLGILFATSAHADWEPKVIAACPDAARERAQLRAARPSPRDVTRVSKPRVLAELLEMEKRDQNARNDYLAALKGGDLTDDHPISQQLVRVDADNLRRLKEIVRRGGFPTIDMVGVDGVHAAFLLTQHADRDSAFQEKMLTMISPRLSDGEITGNEYALLTDRVLLARGKPQKYGTQFEGEGKDLKPLPIADELNVNKLRHSLGMISLEHYSCVLHAAYDSPNSTTATP